MIRQQGDGGQTIEERIDETFNEKAGVRCIVTAKRYTAQAGPSISFGVATQLQNSDHPYYLDLPRAFEPRWGNKPCSFGLNGVAPGWVGGMGVGPVDPGDGTNRRTTIKMGTAGG